MGYGKRCHNSGRKISLDSYPRETASRLFAWQTDSNWRVGFRQNIQEESPRNSFLMSSFLAFLPHKLTPPECPGISPFLIFNILSLFLSQCSRMYHFVIATDLRSTLKMSGNTMITNKIMPKIITCRIIYWTQSRGFNALRLSLNHWPIHQCSKCPSDYC